MPHELTHRNGSQGRGGELPLRDATTDNDDDDRKRRTSFQLHVRRHLPSHLRHAAPVTILALVLFLWLIISFDEAAPMQQRQQLAPGVTAAHGSPKPMNRFITATTTSTTTTTAITATQVENLTIDNVLWSRNYYKHADCPDVPDEYYTLKNVRTWCQHHYTTECNHKADDMKRWFPTCRGTIWIRQQSQHREKTGDLVTFIAEVLPLIQHPFDLVTSDGDNAHPKQVNGYQRLLHNPFLQTWYTQNYNYDGSIHSKVQPIPIGLDLHTLDHFPGVSTSEQALEKMLEIRQRATDPRRKEFWIPPMGGSSVERGRAQQAARCLNPIITTARLTPLALFEKYTQYRFGLSPEGNGPDCHRTWEMLFFGMIPILKTSPMDLIYHKFDLPVVIVSDWTDICHDGFLDQQYERLKDKYPLPVEKLTTGYYLSSRK